MELLVVIAAIAVLMAVLVPCMHAVRKRARAVACQANLKQLYLGLDLYRLNCGSYPYAFDNRRQDAPPTPDPADVRWDLRGWWWFQYAREYLEIKNPCDEKTALWCPARKIADDKFDQNALRGNYGVNLSICKYAYIGWSRREFMGPPLGENDIPTPNRTLLIADAGYSAVSWWNVTKSPPVRPRKAGIELSYVPGLSINQGKEIEQGHETDAVQGRHPTKTVNSVFVDGHVKNRPAEVFLVEKKGDTYTNREPLWRPR